MIQIDQSLGKTAKILIGVFILLVLIVTGLAWYTLNRSQVKTPLNERVSTPSAKTATKSASPSTTKDETSDWITYTNSEVGFLIKYPPNWLITNSSTDNLCQEDQAFLAPDQNLLGRCASGYGGLVGITRTPSGYPINSYIPKQDDSSYQNLKIEEVVSTKRTVKFSGISTVQNEVVDWRGNKIIEYLIDLGDRTLIIVYNQNKNVTDYSETFEKIVSTFKFL